MQHLATVGKNELTHPGQITEGMKELYKRMYCKGVSDDELRIFVNVCNLTGLRPERRQIYAIPRYDGREKRNILSIQISIDGLRTIANNTGLYEGQVGPWWCGDDGTWRDVWLDKSFPVACKVGVLRKGFREPVFATALMRSFYDEKNFLWKKMPEHMLAVRAESLALRKAFPQESMGLYTVDEMNTDTRVIDHQYQESEKREREHNPDAWMEEVVPFEKAHGFTWRECGMNKPFPNGESSRSYLHALAAYKDKEGGKKAQYVLDNVEKCEWTEEINSER